MSCRLISRIRRTAGALLLVAIAATAHGSSMVNFSLSNPARPWSTRVDFNVVPPGAVAPPVVGTDPTTGSNITGSPLTLLPNSTGFDPNFFSVALGNKPGRADPEAALRAVADRRRQRQRHLRADPRFDGQADRWVPAGRSAQLRRQRRSHDEQPVPAPASDRLDRDCRWRSCRSMCRPTRRRAQDTGGSTSSTGSTSTTPTTQSGSRADVGGRLGRSARPGPVAGPVAPARCAVLTATGPGLGKARALAHHGEARQAAVAAVGRLRTRQPRRFPRMDVLISQSEIQTRVAELARQIEADYQGRALTVVGILTGSLVLLADLIRNLHIPLADRPAPGEQLPRCDDRLLGHLADQRVVRPTSPAATCCCSTTSWTPAERSSPWWNG